ncbi:MAG: chemotaxis protein CheW [Leptolyngbyaceae cyanobacterium SU_3_3]|nr:chemotaxis protein CheW [Leptolyngbyaceae cyanobacterium SU_3_3]
MGNLYAAVPLDEVIKVIPIPEIFQSGEKTLGMTYFEGSEVLVVDLHHEIFGSSGTSSQYLIVMRGDTQDFYGMPVSGLPIMKEVSLKNVHPIPSEYRDRDTLGVASHMVQIPIEKELQTIFLLSYEKLRTIVRNQK